MAETRRDRMMDLSKFPCHKKPYADSTLRNMKKGELIGILRDYEHNYGALYSFYENSVKNAEALLKRRSGYHSGPSSPSSRTGTASLSSAEWARMSARAWPEERSRNSALPVAWRYAGTTWSNASPWTWTNGRRYGRATTRPRSWLSRSAGRRRAREHL